MQTESVLPPGLLPVPFEPGDSALICRVGPGHEKKGLPWESVLEMGEDGEEGRLGLWVK